MTKKRAKLIKRYQDMMYMYGEYDLWEDDIEPKLDGMTDDEIQKEYIIDRDYYKAREDAGGFF